MKIDHVDNPLGTVKRFDILYDLERDLHLEGRIRGITEEGFDDANWFGVEVRYVRRDCEIGGNLAGYKEMRRGAPTLEEAEQMLTAWCSEVGFPILSSQIVAKGVKWM